MKETLAMSYTERQRMMIMEKVQQNQITLVEASEMLCISYRQTLRIRDRYKAEGENLLPVAFCRFFVAGHVLVF